MTLRAITILFAAYALSVAGCSSEPPEQHERGFVYSDGSLVGPKSPTDSSEERSDGIGAATSELVGPRKLLCEVFATNSAPGSEPLTLEEFEIPLSDFVNDPFFFFNVELADQTGFDVLFQTLRVQNNVFATTLNFIEPSDFRLVSSGVAQFLRFATRPGFPVVQTGFQPEPPVEIDGTSYDQLQAFCEVSRLFPQ